MSRLRTAERHTLWLMLNAYDRVPLGDRIAQALMRRHMIRQAGTLVTDLGYRMFRTDYYRLTVKGQHAARTLRAWAASHSL